MKLIGREHEQAELMRHFDSGKPEFIAVTGRRRVGKTYLVRELFARHITFYFSGMLGKNVTNTYQLSRFDESITEQGGVSKRASVNCMTSWRRPKRKTGRPFRSRSPKWRTTTPSSCAKKRSRRSRTP
jgi:AAA+ ATPase superfamily predicted ATPase